MSLLLIVISFLVLLITSLYLFIQYRFSYFKRKGIVHSTPKFPNGNITGKLIEDLRNLYSQFKNIDEPFFGAYFFFKPTLIIKDLDLIKSILIRDFHYFPDRGMYLNEKDPLSNHLFSMRPDGWKDQRAKLTPTFTSGKMKYMFPTLVHISERLSNVIENEIKLESEIEFKKFLVRFTTDVIGNVAFGLECNSLKDPNTEFLKQGQIAVNHAFGGRLKRILAGQFNTLAQIIGLKMHTEETINFFQNIVSQTIQLREEHQIQRNDFMDLLLKMKKSEENPTGIDFNQILAHCYVFYLAGFETSSTLMNFVLYELVLNENIQDKCREEIITVLKKHNNELTYEAMTEMQYLERVLNETLRKDSPATLLNRYCTKDYEVPNSKFVIEKGTSIVIPIYEIQNDEKYYPNPEVFDPDRFLPEAVQQRHSMAFLSFGEGPRNCIGLRFGRMQAKIGLIQLLKSFKFSAGEKLQIPLKINPKNSILQMEGGLWLKTNKLN